MRASGADRAAGPEEDGAASDQQAEHEKCERHGPTNAREPGRTATGWDQKISPASPKTYRS